MDHSQFRSAGGNAQGETRQIFPLVRAELGLCPEYRCPCVRIESFHDFIVIGSEFIMISLDHCQGIEGAEQLQTRGGICTVSDSIAKADILIDPQLPAFFKDSPESLQVAVNVTDDCIFHIFHLFCYLFRFLNNGEYSAGIAFMKV